MTNFETENEQYITFLSQVLYIRPELITMAFHHFMLLYLFCFELNAFCISGVPALITNTLRRTRTIKSPHILSRRVEEMNEICELSMYRSSRREWLKKIIFAGSTFKTVATTRKALAREMPGLLLLCDPSISTWYHPPTNRIVHIIGTAHISTSSAALASQAVKEIRPDAVFIELDQRRLIPGGLSMSSLLPSSVLSSFGLYNTEIVESLFLENLVVTPKDFYENYISLALFNPLEAAIGKSLQAYYDKLGRAGYRPGEEFVLAMKAGLDVGAVIVLGDQDTKVTLRRLTEALVNTDMQKLLDPDSELGQKLKALVPEGSDKSIPSISELDDPVARQKLSDYVETMKARETIKDIMKHLKRAAPEIYKVMLADRDVYMANGIHSLHPFPVTVAVMGMAHVDGVEENLRLLGWKPIRYPCPKK